MYFENNRLTERENDVIKLLIQGKSNKQIALGLGISNRTVEFHLSNIYTKLGVNSRTEAILKFTDNHLRKPTGGYQVISTVDKSLDSVENGLKPISRRSTMKKTYYVIGGLFVAVLLLTMIIIHLYTKNNVGYMSTPIDQSVATANNILPLSTETAFTPTVTSPIPTAAEQQLNIAIPPHTVNGYTAAIEAAYADVSHVIFLVRITGGNATFGDEHFFDRVGSPNLYDEYGNLLNASGGEGFNVDPEFYQFEFIPTTLLTGNHVKGQFTFDLNNAPEYENILAQFKFDFDLPIYPETRFYPKQKVIANNLEMLLDSVTTTPAFTQIYLCFPPIIYAPWVIGNQSTLKMGGQESHLIYSSELFNSQTSGDRRAGSEPYWVPPIKDGRCIKMLFPIGDKNPTSFILTIPQLENLTPYLNKDIYLQLPQLYPGLNPRQAYYKYLEENNYTYKGPWMFTVDLVP
ncbi:MAG: helix-turn-helix transcriptional regulator [Anaerolineales bacterium]